ncbi:O-acetylhomoserine aminocarboxypropyltransferase/cysteine synthase, partial [Desulfovibrio sp. OttesenSCG-928-C14]|nr:O-acetylhomoserine aminocarboxypropyltransferase/cysteine synthase [Desulfovibrio sp. OttesenSCG-928-C14]
TIAIHGGKLPDSDQLSCAVPLYRTSAFNFKSAQHAADVFALAEPGNIYTRLGNPTLTALEERMALLEGGAGAVALASGTSASFYAIINLARAGDEIASTANLYGGTYVMFKSILPQFGITVRLVEHGDLEGLRKAINAKTRAVYTESIGNPGLGVADLPAVSALAHEHGLPLLVDATFATPWLQRPFDLGADVTIHSLTKWLGGHGIGLGGIVVDSGRFDWKNERFALYNEPDQSYHDIRWAHDLNGAPPFITRLRTVPLRNLGACISPDNAWFFLQGIETLGLRMDRHSSNALAVARFLEAHPRAAWVRYPGLPSHPDHALAQKVLRNGFGGMVVFGIQPGPQGGTAKEAGQRFIDSLKLFSHVSNVGDAKSLAVHPGSTTHAQLSEAEQRQAGLAPELVRLSIGLEHINDILSDIDQALEGID